MHSPNQLHAVAEREHRASGVAPIEPLVTAAQLAELLQVERCWVYDHKEMLGVRYLGEGPRARLRFSPTEASAALRRSRGEEATVRGPRRATRRSKAPRTSRKTATGNSLLPLPGEAG